MNKRKLSQTPEELIKEKIDRCFNSIRNGYVYTDGLFELLLKRNTNKDLEEDYISYTLNEMNSLCENHHLVSKIIEELLNADILVYRNHYSRVSGNSDSFEEMSSSYRNSKTLYNQYKHINSLNSISCDYKAILRLFDKSIQNRTIFCEIVKLSIVNKDLSSIIYKYVKKPITSR